MNCILLIGLFTQWKGPSVFFIRGSPIWVSGTLAAASFSWKTGEETCHTLNYQPFLYKKSWPLLKQSTISIFKYLLNRHFHPKFCLDMCNCHSDYRLWIMGKPKTFDLESNTLTPTRLSCLEFIKFLMLCFIRWRIAFTSQKKKSGYLVFMT